MASSRNSRSPTTGGPAKVPRRRADPFHPEHESLGEWSDDFDPEAFEFERFAERVARMTTVRRSIEVEA